MTHSIKEMGTCALSYLRRISIYNPSLIGSSVIPIKNILSGGGAIVLVNLIINLYS
jgi:hypothetical protein